MNISSKDLATLQCIHEGSHCLIYHQDTSDYGAPIIVKVLKHAYPSQEQIIRFGNEYELTKDLTLPGIRKAFEALLIEHKPALILEYIAGDTLKNACIKHPRSLADRLALAVSMTEALSALHAHNLIHKDINSNNILINLSAMRATIIDFGIAARLEQRVHQADALDVFEGTLQYIAPEQTGRMSRPVDQRADLYSLGVTLYELFTGQQPFRSDDTAELIHCHLAKTPTPLPQINPEIPDVLSHIVLKLMEKNPESRYQSAFGVTADLERVRQQFTTGSALTCFELGRDDYSGQLQRVQQLHGRAEETRALLQTYAWVSQGPSETLLLAGLPGVGKTTLIQDVQPVITNKGGYFLAGEYDQYQQNTPYYGLIQAITTFIERLLTENEVQLAQWKAILAEVVGGNGQLLTTMIPALELILGQQPPVQELGPTEAQHRFQHLFQNFLRIIAQKDHPLVLVLDNLQWIDAASLNLIALLMTNVATRYVFFIGAYRTNEVGAAHPLLTTVKEMEQAKAVVHTRQLTNLPVEAVNALLADALQCDGSFAHPLTALVYEKTQGNALLTQEYLAALVKDGVLAFDFAARRWTWETEQIRAQAIPENIAAFLTHKIEQLPDNIRETLLLAACIGNIFDLHTLATLAEQPLRTVLDTLLKAMSEGLVRALDDGYKMIPTLAEDEYTGVQSRFEFTHNRLRQTCYAMLPKKRRKMLALTLGRLRLQQMAPADIAEHCFDLAELFNESFQYVKDDQEKLRIAELNLMAGRKAKNATAYQSAIWYLSMGIGMLPPRTKWSDHYDVTLHLYLEAIAAEYLSTNFERARQLSDEALHHAQALLEKITIYQLRILFYTAQNQNSAAIETALAALTLLGVALPSESEQLEEYTTTLRKELGTRIQRIADLAGLPVLQDDVQLAALRILMHAAAPAQQEQPELLAAIILTMVALSVQHGNSPLSAFAYAWYGVLLSSVYGDIAQGYQFGQLAMTLSAQVNAVEVRAKVQFLFQACLCYWQEPLKKIRKPLEDVYQIGLETGDLEYAYYGAIHYCAYTVCLGKSLEDVYQKQARYLEALDKYRLKFHSAFARIWMQMVSNLLGGAADPCQLKGDRFDEAQMLPAWRKENNVVLAFATYFCRTMLQYVFKHYDEAVESGRLGEAYASGGAGFIYLPVHRFYYALALLAHYPAVSAEKQTVYLAKVQDIQNALQQWATAAPMNCQHKVDLLMAEMARLRGDILTAMERYGCAIRGAKEHGYPHEEALAYEREAEFYLDLGRDDLAMLCITKAWDGYRHWGATCKVEALAREHKHLLLTVAPTNGMHPGTTTVTSSTTTAAMLDTAAIIKTTRTLSQEVELPRLLEKVIQIVLENAGAERGVFIEQRQQQFFIQANGQVGCDHIATMQALPLEDAVDLPLAVIYYVARTRFPIVLHNAVEDRTYAADQYIRTRAPKSVLCLPILHQDKLLAILYLENNLIPGAFTADRLELLNVLTSQAAISIEIARHIEQVGEQERLKKEMDLARQIQTAILPKHVDHPEFEIEAVMLAAEEVGGDYYDILSGKDGALWIAIGDVSGHGVTAGLIMMMAQTIHATLATQMDVTPKEVVAMLNAVLYRNVQQRLGEDHFMTFTTLKHLGHGRFQHAGAHLDLIIYRAARCACEVINTTGAWLNVTPDVADITENSEFTLEVGDTLVLYTDGLIEAQNRQAELLDVQRLIEIVNTHAAKEPAALRDAMMQDVLAWSDQVRDDDMSLVVVRRKK